MNSMTGFGVARGRVGRSHIVVEARSLNHRFCEVNLRFPGRYAILEPEVTRLIRQKFSRGKFDLFLKEEMIESEDREISLARKAHKILKRVQKELQLKGDIRLSDVVAFREVFVSQSPREDADLLKGPLLRFIQKSLGGLSLMRSREGARLQKWFLARAAALEKLLGRIEKHALSRGSDYRKRLERRLKKMGSPVPIEDGRLVQEAALMAERADVIEEIVRLRSHLHEFKRFLRESGPIGRKMDFLAQEMGREINTIGSKSQGVLLSHKVIEFKSDLERIKEQIQNIE